MYHPVSYVLLLAACLSGQLAFAQKQPVAPLAPRQVVVQPAALPRWQTIGRPVPTAARPVAPAGQPSRPVPVYLPVILLNSRLIVGDNGLRATNPQDIRDIHIYKGADAPVKWRSLTAHGIIDITLKTKPHYKSKSLADLSRGVGVAGPVRFELDGLPLQDASLRIADEAIAGVDVTRPALGEMGTTVLNIRLVRLPPPPVPPGTIRIRGVAGL